MPVSPPFTLRPFASSIGRYQFQRRLEAQNADSRLAAQQQALSELSSQHVVAVNPDSTTVTVDPMSRPPHIVGAAHVITGATSVIRVWTGTWISRVIPRSIPGIAAIIIIGATGCPDPQSKE